MEVEPDPWSALLRECLARAAPVVEQPLLGAGQLRHLAAPVQAFDAARETFRRILIRRRDLVVALVTDPASIARYLHHLGEPTEPPSLAPARGPPYYQSRGLRRRPSAQQTEMFDA